MELLTVGQGGVMLPLISQEQESLILNAGVEIGTKDSGCRESENSWCAVECPSAEEISEEPRSTITPPKQQID